MNKRNKTMVSIIAIILAVLMVFGLVISVVPYVLADEYVPEAGEAAAEYVISEVSELSA